MTDPAAAVIPDSHAWVWVDATGAPIVDTHQAPVSAHLPMAEATKILALVAYLSSQLAACHAVRATP